MENKRNKTGSQDLVDRNPDYRCSSPAEVDSIPADSTQADNLQLDNLQLDNLQPDNLQPNNLQPNNLQPNSVPPATSLPLDTIDDKEDYPMNPENIGRCYIFNHREFKFYGTKKRSGSDIDAKQLEELFKKLGFEVTRFDDLEETKLSHMLSKASKGNEKYSCIVCCILTYGTDERIRKLYASDDTLKVRHILNRFNGDGCRSLIGKPKFFLIQACPYDSVEVSADEETDGDDSNVPATADFLVAYSTIPGVYSWEDGSSKGSWFINAFCSTIEKHIGDMDLLQLLSIVNNKVTFDYNEWKNYEGTKPKLQVPCVTSTLTRNIKFPVPHHLESKLMEGDSYFLCKSENYSLKNGKVYIFDHETYQSRKGKRLNTEVDAEHLENLFDKLDCDVTFFDDRRADKVLEELKKVAEGSHTEYSCFICCILTHGNYGILKAWDRCYEINEALSLFYDRWVGKPKIFLIQACQGKKNEKAPQEKPATYLHPPKRVFDFIYLTHPDFLIAFATVPGYLSYKNIENVVGSLFMQTFYKVFEKKKVQIRDFLQILTAVSGVVTREFTRKQVPCLTSTLTKNVKF